MDDLTALLRPQQPMRPFWMGDDPDQINERWSVVQGDYLAFYIELFCECPDPVDITHYQFMFTVRESLDPEDPNLMINTLWTEDQGNCGLTALVVQPGDTAECPPGRYWFDLKYRTPSGLVKTIRRGELEVLPTAELELSKGLEVPLW